VRGVQSQAGLADDRDVLLGFEEVVNAPADHFVVV
jgi:hypothetical protein